MAVVGLARLAFLRRLHCHMIIVLDVYLLLGKSSGIAVMRRISHRLGNCDHFDLKHIVLEALIKGKFVMLLYTGK